LKKDLNSFLQEFWAVGAIEDLNHYRLEFSKMQSKWPLAQSCFNFLKAKEEKWAFSFTHSVFVAGISSTRRQEQANQIKANLISNSILAKLVDGFDSVEKSTEARRLRASLV
jgi:hypothetical protein